MRISDWSSDVCSSDLNFAKNARVRTAERSAGRSPAHGRPRRPRRLSQEPVRHAGDGGGDRAFRDKRLLLRSEEHTSELQSLMRISYAVFCLKKKTQQNQHQTHRHTKSTTHKTY